MNAEEELVHCDTLLKEVWFKSYGQPEIDFIYDGAPDPSYPNVKTLGYSRVSLRDIPEGDGNILVALVLEVYVAMSVAGVGKVRDSLPRLLQ